MTRPGGRDPYSAPELPEWMRGQARGDIEGPAGPARPDRPEELAARLAKIRARIHTEALAEDGRRNQLNQWHDDDQAAADAATTENAYLAGYLDGLGNQTTTGDPAGEEGSR